MELVNDFTVAVPIDEAWKVLTDVERIAPCLPGAQLEEVDGDTYRGVVKVKVGPILAQFKGEATFVERDETAHRAALKAKGRDTSGKGNAEAVITAQLVAKGERSTLVTVTTDLTITGRIAQFGRGALAEVSSKLLKQFVEQLHETVLAPGGQSGADTAATTTSDGPVDSAASTTSATEADAAPAASGPRRIPHAEVEPIDLIDTAGASIVKRLAPVGILIIVVLLLLRRRRRS
jgi:carbon monoxide dehydrogenase subunit G